MKLLLTILLLAISLASGLAQVAPTASEQVRQRLEAALRSQIKQFLRASITKRPPPTGSPAPEQLDQQTDALLQQALVRYGPVFTVPNQTAQPLLTRGPNDADNIAAMKRNWETYKKVVLPLPALMKHLHEQFDAGAIKAGWDLELARRVSDTQLTEATDAQHRYEESQKKSP